MNRSFENVRQAFENNWITCSNLFLRYVAGISFIIFLKESKKIFTSQIGFV